MTRESALALAVLIALLVSAPIAAQEGQHLELVIQTGHAEKITSIAVSSKYGVIASGSIDDTIKLWDIRTGQELKTLKGHRSWVNSVAFSPDGKLLISGSADKTIKLWDVQNGREIRTFLGHNDQVSSVSFSSDNHTFASTGWDRNIKMWDIHASRSLRTLAGGCYAIAFSPDGTVLAAEGDNNAVKLWNVASGQVTNILVGHSRPVQSLAFSKDGRLIASGSLDRTIRLWDAQTGQVLKTLADGFIEAVEFSSNGDILLTSNKDNAITLWDVQTGKELRTLRGHTGWVTSATFSADGEWVISGSEDKTIRVWQLASGNSPRTLRGHTPFVWSLAFSPNGKILAAGTENGNVNIWNLVDGQRERDLTGFASSVYQIAFSPDSKLLAGKGTFQYTNSTVKLWDVFSGIELRSYREDNSGKARGLSATVPDFYKDVPYVYRPANNRASVVLGKYRVQTGENSELDLFDLKKGKLQATLIALDETDWVITTPDGRFDTNKSLDQIEGLHWIVNDAILKPLPLDIFMRDYYEPRLLSRILRCTRENNCNTEFKPVRDLSRINRTQPTVEITKVGATDALGTVSVSINVSNVVSENQKDEQDRGLSSGVFDLRLFRDGQLVGYSASDEKVQLTFRSYQNFDDELAVWREANKVDLVNGKKTFTFTVKLPSNLQAKDIEFSAYAFNEDRVKSETARLRWSPTEAAKPPAIQPKAKPRAYVIAVGVNAYENPAFDLQFAANDARRFQEVLPQRLAATGEFSEIVPISLISDWEIRRGQRVTTKRDATKANFKAVLDLLAGRPVADEVKREIPNAGKLAKTTPDDMVLILFSSHGFADQSGNFYFIPYDTGPGACSVFTETVRQRSISSDELSLWLRDVDAGQMTLIVDACYSTAAIEGSGFKPGPMGSRGLGQLAYDKRMRILTATQADNVAMELPATADGRPINHGLLSYALLEDGLGGNKADFKPRDKTIFMDEWLEYAVAEVPKLFANELRPANETQPKSKQRNDRPRLVLLKRELADPGVCRPGPSAGTARIQKQQPSLFDFTRRKREVPLVRNP